MPQKPVLYGFNGSTYVRTLRMMLNENGVDYDQVHVNVLEGEPRQPEHLARHPFGKVPVMDIDGMRLLETDAICRYIAQTGPGTTLIPEDPKTLAKMNEAISLINSYGFGALIGVAGYYLFPDFIGGANDDARATCLADAKKLDGLLMECAEPWICGRKPSLADYFLGPIMFYVSLTPDADKVLTGKMATWWEAMKEVESFKATEPDLG